MPMPPGSVFSLCSDWMYPISARFSSGVSWLSPNTGMFCGPVSSAP